MIAGASTSYKTLALARDSIDLTLEQALQLIRHLTTTISKCPKCKKRVTTTRKMGAYTPQQTNTTAAGLAEDIVSV